MSLRESYRIRTAKSLPQFLNRYRQFVKPTLKLFPAVDPEIAVLLSSRSIDYHEQITGDISSKKHERGTPRARTRDSYASRDCLLCQITASMFALSVRFVNPTRTQSGNLIQRTLAEDSPREDSHHLPHFGPYGHYFELVLFRSQPRKPSIRMVTFPPGFHSQLLGLAR
jgi:hypothetical protein